MTRQRRIGSNRIARDGDGDRPGIDERCWEEGNARCGWIARGCRGGTGGTGGGRGAGGRGRSGCEVTCEGRVEAREGAWRRIEVCGVARERPRPGRSPRPTVPELSEPRARARRTAFGASRENTRAGWRNDAHPDVCACVSTGMCPALSGVLRASMGREPIGRPGTDDAKGIGDPMRKNHRRLAESPIHVGDFLHPDPPTFARALNPFFA